MREGQRPYGYCYFIQYTASPASNNECAPDVIDVPTASTHRRDGATRATTVSRSSRAPSFESLHVAPVTARSAIDPWSNAIALGPAAHPGRLQRNACRQDTAPVAGRGAEAFRKIRPRAGVCAPATRPRGRAALHHRRARRQLGEGQTKKHCQRQNRLQRHNAPTLGTAPRRALVGRPQGLANDTTLGRESRPCGLHRTKIAISTQSNSMIFPRCSHKELGMATLGSVENTLGVSNPKRSQMDAQLCRVLGSPLLRSTSPLPRFGRSAGPQSFRKREHCEQGHRSSKAKSISIRRHRQFRPREREVVLLASVRQPPSSSARWFNTSTIRHNSSP
jgi:hypothetical protein